MSKPGGERDHGQARGERNEGPRAPEEAGAGAPAGSERSEPASTSERYLVISSDCHAGANGAEYRDYVDPEYREKFDEYLAVASMMGGGKGSNEELEAAASSLWDMPNRVKYLEAEGVVAEVIFPQPGGASGPPFYIAGHSYDAADQELTAAGTRAYNRWLADFVAGAPHPERHAGIAQITQYHDVDAAVREIEWAKEAGLFGGMLLRSQPEGDLPGFNHPRYEPMWEACAALDMPVHTHGGEVALNGSLADNFMAPGGPLIFFTEVTWFGHRPLWYLIWGGVLERHPNLKLVFTEQFADWVPDVLWRMDSIYERFAVNMPNPLPMKPSEYWARQCFVGSSLMTRRETERRYEIGIPNLMWGTDFPHAEGTYPESERHLHEALDGLADDELRAILGENAARVYGFDLEALRPVADDIGPAPDFFAA